MTEINPNRMTRVRDLPEKLSVSRSTVYAWFRQGLKRVWLGRVAYVTHDDLAAFADVDVHLDKTKYANPGRPYKSKSLAMIEAMEAASRANRKRQR